MTAEQRRLAAIVSADVAGYSRLMGRDESGTVPDFGTCQSPAHANASSSAFASLRSGVSKPSVNQP